MFRGSASMCEVSDKINFRVVNKGVDVTIISSSTTIKESMKASRTLVVTGISTAVIEVITINSPLDEEVFLNFAKETHAIIFTEQYIYEAVIGILNNQYPLIIEVIKEPTVQNIIKTAIEVIKFKLRK